MKQGPLTTDPGRKETSNHELLETVMWGGWAIPSTENKDRTEQNYQNNHFKKLEHKTSIQYTNAAYIGNSER